MVYIFFWGGKLTRLHERRASAAKTPRPPTRRHHSRVAQWWAWNRRRMAPRPRWSLRAGAGKPRPRTEAPVCHRLDGQQPRDACARARALHVSAGDHPAHRGANRVGGSKAGSRERDRSCQRWQCSKRGDVRPARARSNLNLLPSGQQRRLLGGDELRSKPERVVPSRVHYPPSPLRTGPECVDEWSFAAIHHSALRESLIPSWKFMRAFAPPGEAPGSGREDSRGTGIRHVGRPLLGERRVPTSRCCDLVLLAGFVGGSYISRRFCNLRDTTQL